MLEGSIGNFTSRVLATFTALPRALRLGMPRGTWQLFVVQLVGFALDGLVVLYGFLRDPTVVVQHHTVS